MDQTAGQRPAARRRIVEAAPIYAERDAARDRRLAASRRLKVSILETRLWKKHRGDDKANQ